MIDDPEKAVRLMTDLTASLPVEVRLSQRLIRVGAGQLPDSVLAARLEVTSVNYAGDEGGIVCGLRISGPESDRAYHVSITQLVFDRRLTLFRQIDVYQRHRIKKLKRQGARDEKY